MKRLIECVPNFSEGRDASKVDALVDVMRGVPGVFALPAGIGDVITGLLAVPVAIAVAAGTIEGRKAAIAWSGSPTALPKRCFAALAKRPN